MNNKVIDQFEELVTTQATPQVEALIKILKGETNIDFLRANYGEKSIYTVFLILLNNRRTLEK